MAHAADFVIVGSGTAGCVLASRLSDDGVTNVTLIEAGARPTHPAVNIPAAFAQLFKSDHDWNFATTPQTSAGGRVVYTPRGKMLGGSSNMNAQVHQWCHPAGFDGWRDAGAVGWGWQDVAPIFRSQEAWTGTSNYQRGRTGPLRVEPNRYANALSFALVETARSSGLNGTEDYNGGPFEGAWISQLAHKEGRRFSTYQGYLEPALERPNLNTVANAHALKIVFEGRRAVGVLVRTANGDTLFRAQRGVILACGAFGSPQLMMCSGLGDAVELRRLGIPVLRNMPEVGANLQDHPAATLSYATSRTDSFLTIESAANVREYETRQGGPHASGGAQALVFARPAGLDVNTPDIELIGLPLEWRNQALDPPRMHAYTIAAAVLAPRSRGSVRLSSADPLAAPIIDPALLSDPEGSDKSVLLAAIYLARELAARPPFCKEIEREVVPGPAIVRDEDLLECAYANLQTVYHPTSTCRMGSDATAVVNPKLEVNGVDGLWIADASVMPTVPRGHPNAVVAMIANRAAHFLLAA